ncbi:hypothetical protein ACF0H5_020341 [Mactra antiquata]
MAEILKQVIILCAVFLVHGDAKTINDTKTLLADLLTDYNINVRPVANQSEAVHVLIQPFIKSIQEFDEVQGKISFATALVVIWHDVNMMWNPVLYGNITEITVLYNNVWIPELILLSPAEDVDALGMKWNRIRYKADGLAYWLPADLIESTCSVNVRNYPFDIQRCETSFIALGYTDYEVKLHPLASEFDLSVYQENAAWYIQKTMVLQADANDISQINLILVLERKPSFVVVNVILPILFLSLLNVIVFLLIPESGERVSYAITVLLSIAVFMTIVSDLLPRNSESVPIISFKLMVDMVISSFIVFVTIINLSWYYTDDKVPVPSRAQSLYRALKCCSKKSSQIDPVLNKEEENASKKMKKRNMDTKIVSLQDIESEIIKRPIPEDNVIPDDDTQEIVTWKMLSNLVDKIAFVAFTFGSICSFVVFMTLTALGSKSFINMVLLQNLVIIIFALYVTPGDTKTINDTKTLLSNLFSDYNINVRPIANQSEAVHVFVQPYIKSIQNFDEVQGKISFSAALLVLWHDVNVMWNPELYGNITEITVLYNNVWIPELILVSPAEDVDALGMKWNRIRYAANGLANWLPADLVESTCSVNVRNYPFDIQSCETSFIALGYTNYEVKLHPLASKFDLSVYQGNAAWTLQKTMVSQADTNGISQINLILVLERKPSFVIINVILPILFLSLLNVIVFLLIPESGERVSYAITVLLAIAVFMTIVSDMLPRNSESVPIISYKLMIDMVISSLIVFVTIINLSWYYADEKVPVPSWAQIVYRALECHGYKTSQENTVLNREVRNASKEQGSQNKNVKIASVQHVEVEVVNHALSELNVGPHNDKEEIVSWKMLSKLVDKIALVAFTFGSICSCVMFVTLTALGSK